MTIERQALVERLRKLATERATNGGGNDPCPPEAECDDCDSVRAMREAADALEALSSSAPVETPQLNDDDPHPLMQELYDAIEAMPYADYISSEDASFPDRLIAIVKLHSEVAPADPPIPSPGDEERKDAIAWRVADELSARGQPVGYERTFVNVSKGVLVDAIKRALSDYEIKAGAK